MRSRSRTLVTVLALTLGGCSADGLGSGGEEEPQPDLASAPPDLAAAPQDLRPPPASGIGEPCTGSGGLGQGSCGDGQICFPDQFGFPDGYCSAFCGGGMMCPADARCIMTQFGRSVCLYRCATDGDCRDDNYLCDPNQKACVPANQGDGVRPGTRDGGACVQPIVAPGQGLKSPFGRNVQASRGAQFEAENSVAVDPKTRSVVVPYIAIGQTSLIGVTRSGDDGATFGAPTLLPQNGSINMNRAQSDPVVVVDAMGQFWLTWIGYDPQQGGRTANMKVWVARSRSGGMAWEDLFLASGPNEWNANNQLDKPWIAAGPDGTVWVTWNRSTQQAVDIRMTRTTDGGKTWAPPVTINDVGLGARGSYARNLAQIAVGSDSKPFVAWVEIQMERFGSTANRIYTQRVNADGTLNGRNVVVGKAGDSPVFDDPSVAVFPPSTVYVGFVNGTPRGAWDVRVASSIDGGATFATSVKANDDETCATHFHHQIAVDAKGNVHAIWFDNRYLQGNVFYASSGPADKMNSLKFSRNTFVNDVSFPFTTRRDQSNWLGDYLALVVSGGSLYAAWTDPRTTNRSHIYFASGKLP